MRVNRVVVIGASSGGIETLRTLVAALPADFPAPVCVVTHTSPQSPAILSQILSRAGELPAVTAATGMRIEPGRIYVAPPDFHLLIEPGVLILTRGPRENRFRPAIDPLFRTAAQVYGPRVVGVILSGDLDDGVAGLWTIKQLGGLAIAQDPSDALFAEMPRNAIQHVKVDYVVRLAELAPLLARVAAVPLEAAPPVDLPRELEVEVSIAKEHDPLTAGLREIGEPSSYACPECHGVLLRVKEGGRFRFRCHTGHAFSTASLIAAISEGIEDSLWNAIRALEEGSMLMERMAEHFRASHDDAESERLIGRSRETRHQADALRRLANHRDPLPTATEP